MVFIKETPSCEYYFTWTTPSACPVKKLTGNNCQVQNPLTHDNYDLRPLANRVKDYKVAISANKFYSINICQKLLSHCSSASSGACLSTGLLFMIVLKENCYY